MAEPLTVACEHCKSKLKLKSAAAVGKKIACPKCKKPFTVKAPPEKSEDDLFDDLPLDNYEAPEEEPKEEEEEAPRSKGKAGGKGKKGGKKRKSSSSDTSGLLLTVLFVLLGVGGIGGIGYAVFQFLPSGSGGLAGYLPEDVDTIVHVRVADLAAAPFFSPLANDPTLKGMMEKAQKQQGASAGPKPSDIESLTFGYIGGLADAKPSPFGLLVTPPTSTRFVGVLRSKIPIDVQQLKTVFMPDAKPANHNGQEYFVGTAQGQTLAYFRPNENILVFGSEAELKGAIDGKGAAPARSRFKFVDQTQQVVRAFAPKDLSLLRTKFGVQEKGKESAQASGDIVLGISEGIKLTSDLQLRRDTFYNSKDTAKNSVDAEKVLAEEWATTLNQVKGMLVFFGASAPASAQKISDEIKKGTDGRTVTATGATVVQQITIAGSVGNDLKEIAVGGVKAMEAMATGMGGVPFADGAMPSALPAGAVSLPGLPAGTLPESSAAIPAGAAPELTPAPAAPSSAAPAPATVPTVPAGSATLPVGNPTIPANAGAPPTAPAGAAPPKP